MRRGTFPPLADGERLGHQCEQNFLGALQGVARRDFAPAGRDSAWARRQQSFPSTNVQQSSQPRENAALEQQFSTGALPHTSGMSDYVLILSSQDRPDEERHSRSRDSPEEAQVAGEGSCGACR